MNIGVNSDAIDSAAEQLRVAAQTGQPCAPVREILKTDSDLDVAYAVQQKNTELAVEQGRRISGRKIGLTAKAVQEAFGFDQPDFGTLFVDMCFAEGVEIPAGRLLQAKAEAEVALVLDHDLDKGKHCVVDILNATAYALPSIELIDSRILDWDLTIVDTVADNASSGLYVVGSKPVALESLDMLTVPMSMTVNGSEQSTGVGSACLGNPLHAAVWLADEMCARGIPLEAGQCLMTGALGPIVAVSEGDEIHADFGPLGAISAKMQVADG